MESSWISDSEEEELSRPEQDFARDEPTVVSLNSPLTNPSPSFRSPLFRSVSAGEPLFRSDQLPSSSFQRPSQSMHAQLPDPSQYPDPYPSSYPLSSPDSSTASTRSSAYTSFGSALNEQVHVLVAESDGHPVGLGITSDSVVQLLGGDAAPSQSRAPVDQTRWSGLYSGGMRSRSSSASNGNAVVEHPKLREQPSYDMSWQAINERDEIGVSEEDTDDEHLLTEDDYDEEDAEEEERTAAVVVAEEGRGLIVQANNTSVAQLHVQPGTTHLLIGSSTTPNAMPSFITNTIPQICHSLLALDISANFLGALPPVLALCHCLEELNIASNPLRVLPVFLADLTNLRVLIADSTGITTLPDPLADLDKLHTISVRRNKLHALPSWFCLLPSLQALYVDGNPFQGPWKALVEPLLAKVPMTPAYPLSTPTFPLTSASVQSSFDTETDPDDLSDPPSSSAPNESKFMLSPEEDHTITPESAPFLARRMPSESPSLASQQTANTTSSGISNAIPSARIPPVPSQTQPQSVQPRPLTRNRTTPNRSFYNQSRGSQNSNSPYLPSNSPNRSTSESQYLEDPGYLGDREVRKMKSAGDLRRGRSATAVSSGTVPENVPPRPTLGHYTTSLSSSNLLSMGSSGSGVAGVGPSEDVFPERPGAPKKFASLGATTTLGSLGLSPGSRPSTSRVALTQSLWDNISDNGDSEDSPEPSRMSFMPKETSPPPRKQHSRMRSGVEDDEVLDGKATVRPKEKSSRWGFLKKMSMGKIRTDSPSRLGASPGTGINTTSRPQLRHPAGPNGSTPERGSRSPQIDMRISTTGTLDPFPKSVLRSPSPPPKIPTMVTTPLEEEVEDTQPPAPPPKQLSTDALKLSTTSTPSSSPHLNPSSPPALLPPSPTHRSGKRRSFLPIDAATAPVTLNIPIPDNTHFVPGVTAMNGEDTLDSNTHSNSSSINLSPNVRDNTPSPRPNIMDREAFLKREEERARESYTRALRSVMAYLKDMNDLGLSQTGNTLNMYGMPGESRSRRPTLVVDAHSPTPREVSMALSGTTAVSSMVEAGRTISVATTDSSGSSEERKIKDDKGKRAMVMREILVTERTYVKGLQELMDIYIKPACTNVTILSGVGSSKETVVPAPERKIVFGGLDALFSFHKESFLPSLEAAIAPLMKSSAEKEDSDGQLSLTVANAVANIFFKHAAFMKMYSTYINNFDNAVHRVKYWSSSSSAGPGPTLSPSSSTAQLVGLGLSMSAISNPNAVAEGAAASGAPTLSSSQKKRIKQYLKRCRLNPQHSQLNLEGYLLLPVQRIPRYRLLLEELRRSTPLEYDYLEDTLDRALGEIASLANNMNEGKRESESRRKLVQWQSRIRGKFPSPLVQPHRRLIMDGPLLLTRVVRKAIVTFETINAQGDASTVDVDCLAPELTPRPLLGILCNDLLVLCRDPSEGRDPASQVDLWAVLRMQTLPQPASIVHGNALRLVDNKAILYFDAPSASEALNWFRAINLHIPASKT